MEQRTLVKWLKILVLFAAVCGLGLAGGVLPLAGPVSYTHLDVYTRQGGNEYERI